MQQETGSVEREVQRRGRGRANRVLNWPGVRGVARYKIEKVCWGQISRISKADGEQSGIKVEGKQALLFFHFFFEMVKYAIILNTAVNILMFFSRQKLKCNCRSS